MCFTLLLALKAIIVNFIQRKPWHERRIVKNISSSPMIPEVSKNFLQGFLKKYKILKDIYFKDYQIVELEF